MRKLFLTVFIILLYVKVVCAQQYQYISNKQMRCMDASSEYYVNKSLINSAFQEKKYLENLKKNYSVLNKDGSIQRSRIQAVINAKDNEMFRLNNRNEFIYRYKLSRQ